MLTGVVLTLATIATGLVAGAYSLYAHTIMPGLRRADDRTFVGAFQLIDRAIINPWFMSCFFGAGVLAGLATLLSLGSDGGGVLLWTGLGFVSYVATIAITITVNVPLNNALKAAGDPDQIDLLQVRRAFNEPKWTAWNLVRVVLSVAACGCLAVALIQYGAQG